MTQPDVVTILNEIAVLLELIGENPFKVRAYHNAARTLEGETEEVDELVRSGKLATLPGFGEALTEKVTTLVTTGRLPYYEDLKKKVPAGLLEMIRIQGLGPKKAKVLFQKLKIDSIAKLEKACREHKVAGIEGFGEKSEQKILSGIGHLKKYSERHLYNEALRSAEALLARLKQRPGVIRSEIGGSLRRHRETILGHATGRLLLSREPYAVDMKKVIDAAADYGKVIELNASPHRLDLDWRLGPYAKSKGVKVAIDPDAHSIEGLSHYRYGVGIARKGWMTKDDVVTTLPLSRMERFLELRS